MHLQKVGFKMKRTVAIALSFICVLGIASAAFAVVMDGRIEGVPGFRFENLRYEWDRLSIDIVNMANRNATFGGTIVFLDRFGKPVASACLLPQKVTRNSIKRYTGAFTEGGGETARRAVKVIWDFRHE